MSPGWQPCRARWGDRPDSHRLNPGSQPEASSASASVTVENKGVEPFPAILQGSPARRRVPRAPPPGLEPGASRVTTGRAACCTSGECVPSAGVEPASPASEASVVSVGPQGRGRSPGTRTPNPRGKSPLLVLLSLRPAEDAGVEPARRSHADHRFRDGCLTGLGQSSKSRCQESNLVRRLIRALHRPPCSTSCAAEGARIERAPGVEPGPRISNPVPYHSASPPMCCSSRVRTSVSGFRARRPCRLDQRASGTPTRIRTWTERVLSALPLPLGYRGVESTSLAWDLNPVPPAYETGARAG